MILSIRDILIQIKEAMVWMALCIASLFHPNLELVTGINAKRWRRFLLGVAIFCIGILLGRHL